MTKAIDTGVAVNTVRVSTGSPETELSNNIASALARIIGPLRPPAAVVCRYVTLRPSVLAAKRTSVVVARAVDRNGRRVRGLVLELSGPGFKRRATTDANGMARFVVTPSRRGNLYINPPGRRTAAGGTPPCASAIGVLGITTTLPSLTG